ncbi:MAG: MFS transporter [Myxococcota bacterium]
MAQDVSVTWRGTCIWLICVLFFLYEFLLRTIIGTFKQPMMADLELSSLQFSLLSTTLFLAIYGTMQLPVGFIVQHHGLKKSMFAAAMICWCAVAGFAASTHFFWLCLFRILMGLGGSFGFICLLMVVYDWMPNRYSGLYIGLSQLLGTLGPMFTAAPLETILHNSSIHWRTVFAVLAWCGICIALLILLFVEGNPSRQGSYVVLKRPGTIKYAIKYIFLRLQPWAIAVFCASVYFSVEYLSENEGRELIAFRGHDSHLASYSITLSWVGYAIGCPLLGFFSDFFQRRKQALIFAAICCAVAVATLFVATSRYYVVAAFFLLGFAAGGQSLGFAVMAEQFKKAHLALGLAFNNTMIALVASVNAPVIGWIVDCCKSDSAYTVQSYTAVFIFLGAVACVAVFSSLFLIQETFCKSAVDFTYLTKKTAH